jgi:hypothetical protein
MSGKHWSSASESKNQINKLIENKTYNIVNVDKIQTSFGKKYVLVDDSNNRYWTNNKLDSFIKENKDVKKFTLTTSELKSFTNKKGQKICYLDINIDY